RTLALRASNANLNTNGLVATRSDLRRGGQERVRSPWHLILISHPASRRQLARRAVHRDRVSEGLLPEVPPVPTLFPSDGARPLQARSGKPATPFTFSARVINSRSRLPGGTCGGPAGRRDLLERELTMR